MEKSDGRHAEYKAMHQFSHRTKVGPAPINTGSQCIKSIQAPSTAIVLLLNALDWQF